MQSGYCPKCGSDTVHFSSKASWRRLLLSNWRAEAKVMIYCCTYCGYVEEYVLSEDRAKIAEHWERVIAEEKHKRDHDM